MKTNLLSLSAIMIFLFLGCEKEESTQKMDVDISSFSFTACPPDLESIYDPIPSVRLIGQPNGTLSVKMLNTEFCCATDSVSIDKTSGVDKLSFEVIDYGPFSYCFCPHDLEFDITSLQNKAYELVFIESENSYLCDTFFIQIDFSDQLDTLISKTYTHAPCDQNVIISKTAYENAPDDYVMISEMTITGDCLNIKYAGSGCNGYTWIVKLIDAGIIAESYPVQRTLRLSLDDDEACRAVIEKEISFNIKDLQVAGDDKVLLNVSGEEILYEY